MNTFTLLESRFFKQMELGNEKNIKAHYEEFRTLLVSYAHQGVSWRDIHTGLTIFISEIEHLITNINTEELIGYGRRILSIASRLLQQLELMVKSGNLPCNSDAPTAESKPAKRVKLTAKYTAVCEIINMIISMQMLNGGEITNSEVITRIHDVFGLDYTPDKYYKTRGEIIRRCPADECRTYFLKSAIEVLNNEYISA